MKEAPPLLPYVSLALGVVLMSYSAIALTAFMASARQVIMLSSVFSPDGFAAQRNSSLLSLFVLFAAGIAIAVISINRILQDKKRRRF